MNMKRPIVKIKRLAKSRGLPLPARASNGASGVDLLACVTDHLEIRPGEFACVPTGLCVEIPWGYEAQVRSRSGLALRNGITVLNSPGTVDSDYRGEIGVVLINHGTDIFRLSRGDRVAQLVICEVCDPVFEEVSCLEESDRNEGGFGHTGI
jgi:dUTP pyrophosphatase